LAFNCIPTKYAIIIYAKIPTIENIPLVTTAVLPDFSPLAVSLYAHTEIIGSITITYVVSAPINPHVPNSSGESLLVTINVNIVPVIIVEKVMINEINPEYVTLIFDNISHPYVLSNVLKFSYYMNKPVYTF